MTVIRQVRCLYCGAWLAPGRQRGSLCGTCEEIGSAARAALPADFYDWPPIVAALADYDFGAFFRSVRDLTGWSQQTFGGIIGMDQARVSAIERGIGRLRDIKQIVRVAQGLQIPPARLNFPDIGVTVGRAGVAERKDVSWVDRRDFGQHIAAAVLGIAGAGGLDVDRLLSLLPQGEPTGSRQVGAADVEVIEQFTATFKRQDFAGGSGRIRDAAVAYLTAVLPLLDAQVSPEVRPRLMIATAHLAMQAGYASFDVEQHDAARRLWMTALDLARHAEHPFGVDLTVFVLHDLALQALHLRRPDEALHLIRVGHTAAVSRYPVSGSTLSWLTGVQAEAHSAQGDAVARDRALGQAEEHFAAIDPANRLPWGASYGVARLTADQGSAYYAQALADRDPRAASQAVPLLRQAVDDFGPGYARDRGLFLPYLSGAHALAGDADTAVTVGHQAVDAVTALSSPRAHYRLRTLHTVLEPLHTTPGVADLRARLTATAA